MFTGNIVSILKTCPNPYPLFPLSSVCLIPSSIVPGGDELFAELGLSKIKALTGGSCK